MLCGGIVNRKGDIVSKAKVIDPFTHIEEYWDDWITMTPGENEPFIKASGEKRIRAPEVIVAIHYHKVPRNQLNFNRRNLFRRDENQCQYCLCKPGEAHLSVEHIFPKSRGGKDNWENCVAACFECNQKKKDMTPEEAGMKLRRQPTKPGLEILGLSNRLKSWDIFFNKT